MKPYLALLLAAVPVLAADAVPRMPMPLRTKKRPPGGG